MVIKQQGELIISHKVEQQQCIVNKYGDGVAWYRGEMIGEGSFGSVFLATSKKPKSKFSCFPSVMAVKSAEVSVSGSIQKEREIMSNVGRCNNVIRCFGEETTIGENGVMVYNLLLEYGSGGTLADLIKKSGGKGLPESDVRRYSRSVLRGIYHIHESGYVHCDLKSENILLVRNNSRSCSTEFRAKVGDLGLAKRCEQRKKRKLDPYCRGTLMYLSPEALADSIQEAPSDIWAFGCVVLEMLTGKPPWDGTQDFDANELLQRIADGHELPKIPNRLSIEAREFLKGCFVRKPMYRLTAEMLLNHPFLEGLVDDDDEGGEFEEISDVNTSSSLLVLSVADDDFSSSFEDDCCSEESVSYWSEEEIDGEDITSLDTERALEEHSSSNSESIHVINTPIQAPSNARHLHDCFIIPAGV